jgi:hypothetical protein
MQTIEDRLRTIVPLLPKAEQTRFAAPFAADESADSRLVDAVQTLARAEGLVCHTQAELARVKAKMLPAATRPLTADDEATALAARFAACKTPHAQTVFWRELTPWERTVFTHAKPAKT